MNLICVAHIFIYFCIIILFSGKGGKAQETTQHIALKNTEIGRSFWDVEFFSFGQNRKVDRKCYFVSKD